MTEYARFASLFARREYRRKIPAITIAIAKRADTPIFSARSSEKRVARHFFGYGQCLERGLRHLAPLIGNTGFLGELVNGVLFAQLHADSCQQLGRFPRRGKNIVGAKIEAAGAFQPRLLA